MLVHSIKNMDNSVLDGSSGHVNVVCMEINVLLVGNGCGGLGKSKGPKGS
jgi:hypothetical protein